ncbi:LOW QUALITY PROTEIN: gamma-tubulin complex component 2 homolog [Drosophila tropicalis]|uniref:LOW QUALITY PROTEIN: gamma-tubulin complex component 2 homolog n=1 Tax=Drosophila tropicalis TaxID=46794 RepID=UPI0035AB6DDA
MNSTLTENSDGKATVDYKDPLSGGDRIGMPEKSSHHSSTSSLPSMSFHSMDPKQRSWIFESVGGYFAPAEDLSKLSPTRQEKLLMRDLIYAFSGVPSTHISADITVEEMADLSPDDMSKIRFKIDDGFTSVFRTLANELLPMIGHYISVQGFIDLTKMTPRCERTCLALANSMDNIMQQYHDLQSNLETELSEKKLDLQKLVEQIRPWLPTMEIFATIAVDMRHLKLNSSQLLSMLEDRYQEQKSKAKLEVKERLGQMLEYTSRNYMKMVQQWTQKGIINDTKQEFFIEDLNPAADNCWDSYWKTRYYLHTNRLPNFLLQQAEIILLAGKYFNILRQCNVIITPMNALLTYSPKDMTHLEIIRNSYELPAKKLKDYLFKDHQMVMHLRNLRNFCLLREKRFANDLMENSRQYMKNKVYQLKSNKMDGFLEKILEFLDDDFGVLFEMQLKEVDVMTQLKGIEPLNSGNENFASDTLDIHNSNGYETLALHYEVNWPVSLVINSQRLEQVQILHRVIFFLLHVKSELEAKKPIANSRSHRLRERMVKIILSVEQYMTMDIIEPQWTELITTVTRASNIDEVLSAFKHTLDQCVQLCLFAGIVYVRSIFTLGSICLNYCDSLSIETDSLEFNRCVAEYEENFESMLSSILGLVREFSKTVVKSGRANEKVPESSRQLLLRLESIDKDLEAKSFC